MSDLGVSVAVTALDIKLTAMQAAVLAEVGYVSNRVNLVSNAVDQVHGELSQTRGELAQLHQQFQEFVQLDNLAKQLQLAETKIINVRQELETKYGKYQEVRDVTIGLLQAVDLNLIRKDTIRYASEELLMKVPRYWLGPALVSLAAWVNDQKELADRAMIEALRRDDNKASLFYSLIARRGHRPTPTLFWLQRYFLQQDPSALDRETMVLLDGITGGVFGAYGKTVAFDCILEWLKELGQRSGFIEEQRTQWIKAFEEKKIPPLPTEFPYLQKGSTNWQEIQSTLAGVRLHQILLDHFERIFKGELPTAPTLKNAVDNLLESLTCKFDDEELPYREEERKLSLIIEEGGDKSKATKRLELELQSFKQKVSFTQLLTNASLRPATSGSSVATQRFAVALSGAWIKEAHSDLTGRIRKAIVGQIQLLVDDWKGTSLDGTNENELILSFIDEINRREAAAIAALRFATPGRIVVSVILALLSFVLGPWFFIGWLIIAAVLFYQWNGVNQAKQRLAKEFEKKRVDGVAIVRALCAEIVELRSHIAIEDVKAEKFQEYLKTIAPNQHIQSNYSTERALLA